MIEDKFWELVEKYRCSGGSDEHRANKMILEYHVKDMLEEAYTSGYITAAFWGEKQELLKHLGTEHYEKARTVALRT